MKFIISRMELNDLINRVQGVVPTKATLPILSNILLEAANDELILTATDLSIGIRCHTETKVLEEGKTTIPVKRLAQLVRELTATSLEISSHNDVTELKAGSSTFKLHGNNSQEFPTLPNFEGATSFTVSQPALKQMFFRTSFAVAREDARFVLTGVLMQIANSVATFVATDARRLSRAHIDIDIPLEFSGSYSIPIKAIEEITRNLTDAPGDMATVFLLQDRIAIEANHVTIISKLLQGEYPDYNQIIPQSCETLLRVHREEFTSLLRQISLFTTQKSPSARFAFGQGELLLSKNSVEGEGRVSMPLDYQGSKIEVAFDPNSLLDILRHCNEEVITLGLGEPLSPSVITDQNQESSATAAQPNPLYVLMPLRLSEV